CFLPRSGRTTFSCRSPKWLAPGPATASACSRLGPRWNGGRCSSTKEGPAATRAWFAPAQRARERGEVLTYAQDQPAGSVPDPLGVMACRAPGLLGEVACRVPGLPQIRARVIVQRID